MRLQNKSALITGASSGIGKAIAEAFAREGARVAIADVDLEGAEKAARKIQSSTAAAIAVKMDVTCESEVDDGIACVSKSFGGLDILVSNAGIQVINQITDFSFADWEKVLAVHLNGAFLTTRASMRAMVSHGRGGCILYLGSIHSHIASPNKSAYVSAKHGIIGLAKAVAKEGAKNGIRSNVICPSFVKTALVEKQIPEQAKQLGITEEQVIKNVMLRETVDGAFTSLEEVAETAVFLAAFPTLALTGQSIVVGHGHVMQ
jgi:3-hydroxybutyrate dehydrogenase